MFHPGYLRLPRGRSGLLAIAIAIAAVVSFGCSDDDPVTPPPPAAPNTALNATLDATQLVPPLTTVNGSGTGTFTLSANKDEMSFRVTFGSLSGDIAAAHFHNAAAGAIGPVVRNIFGDLTGNTFEGVWRSTDVESLTTTLVQALLDGNIYVNLHTTAFPTGEIRGQMLQITTGAPYEAALDPSQQVPPLASGGSGTGSFVLNAAETELIFSVSFGGLTGSGIPTGAHFHNAAAGETGPAVRGIFKSLSRNTFLGSWSSTNSEPLTPALVQELKSGRIYVNIHTSTNLDGEIRGQVLLVP